jgi:hypothetical protein
MNLMGDQRCEVACGVCFASLPHESPSQTEREPCPHCGSLARDIKASARDDEGLVTKGKPDEDRPAKHSL